MVSSKCLVSCVQVYNGVNPLYMCKVLSVYRCEGVLCVQMCKVFLCTDV